MPNRLLWATLLAEMFRVRAVVNSSSLAFSPDVVGVIGAGLHPGLLLVNFPTKATSIR